MKVYILNENGDDHHGSRAINAYLSKGDAERAKAAAESDPGMACVDCGHTWWYTINELDLIGGGE